MHYLAGVSCSHCKLSMIASCSYDTLIHHFSDHEYSLVPADGQDGDNMESRARTCDPWLFVTPRVPSRTRLNMAQKPKLSRIVTWLCSSALQPTLPANCDAPEGRRSSFDQDRVHICPCWVSIHSSSSSSSSSIPISSISSISWSMGISNPSSSSSSSVSISTSAPAEG